MTRLARAVVARAFVTALAVTAFAFIAAAPASATGVTVTDLGNGATAQALASALGGGGVAVSNVTFAGANRAAGSFTGGTSSIGFDSGVVLSSGNVQTYGGGTPDGPCSRGVEGPNNCNEDASATDGGENSTGLGTPGDTDLDGLLTNQTTEDATSLSFDFVPQQSTVHFSYVFSSEEYNDFANTGFNDVFAFFVNGTNCALVPGTSDPVSVNNINNGNPGGDTTAHHAEFFRDNVRPTPGSIDSQMDGLTTVLTCNAAVNAGVTNHMKLAIADVGDSAFDSAVFIQSGSLISGRTLTVSKSGTGTGAVTSSPAGINCGATCSHQFADGTPVTLSALADAGSTFTGWSGEGCTGTADCQVTMDQARSVTATFTLNAPQTLTVSEDGTGTGTVTSSPAGIDCGATCSHGFAGGTVVTLTPTESFDSQFAGWSGDCTGTGGCSVTMSAAKNVTATFNLRPTHTITVTKDGSGTGSVSSTPAGINCGATCTQSFPDGRDIVLTATADAGSVFTGWSGAGCSGTGTCTVNLSGSNATVTATFALLRTLTVTKNGTGSGGVSSSPAGINCGATCSAQYVDGTTVTLTATAASGSTFTGWSGEGCSGTGTCVVTMSQARNVTATFDTITPTTVNHTLTATKGGSGSGSVTSAPAGINCGGTCSASYTSPTSVTLTATPASGSTFVGWSGDCTGTGACTLTMSADHTVTATFDTVPPVITPPGVSASDLFCGAQHRGKCKGLPVKGIFDRPGNASWTFAAFNPNPGKGATAAKATKVNLGGIKKAIKKAGTVTVVFKLKPGAKTNKVYKHVKRLKLRNLLITLRFTDASGVTVVQTKTIKLKL